MTDLKDRVSAGLDALRAGLTSDGADLEVEQLTESDVQVSLVLTSETCAECIVPTDVMETMVQNLVGQVAPEAQVKFIDPRAND